MATTPYPFVASTVLTASKLNSTFNIPVSTKTTSYVFVAADGGTRVVMNAAGSTTLTVNTSLFSAGDSVEIHNIGAGTTTITAGTATVTSAGPLAIPQYGGGKLFFTSASAAIYFPTAVTPLAVSSGLVFISSGALSGASTTFTNAFSATYDNYKILISNINNSSQKSLTLGSSSSLYESSSQYVQSGGAWTGMGAVTDKFKIADSSGTRNGNISIEIMSPFLSTTTSFLSFATGEDTARYMCIGIHNSSTSFTDFTFTTSGGTMTGTARIYGYSNS